MSGHSPELLLSSMKPFGPCGAPPGQNHGSLTCSDFKGWCFSGVWLPKISHPPSNLNVREPWFLSRWWHSPGCTKDGHTLPMLTPSVRPKVRPLFMAQKVTVSWPGALANAPQMLATGPGATNMRICYSTINETARNKASPYIYFYGWIIVHMSMAQLQNFARSRSVANFAHAQYKRVSGTNWGVTTTGRERN